MAENDYKELVDFMGKQLEKIHSEIIQTKNELKNELKNDIEEAKRHTGVLIEEVNHRLDLIVEGLTGTQDGRKQDKIENEQAHEQLDKRILINSADISALDQRVGRLEGI